MEDPTKPSAEVCEALRAWREKQDLSVREAADLAGMSSSYWQDLEQRKKAPSQGVALALAKVTGIPADRWLTPKEHERIDRAREPVNGRGDASISHTTSDFAPRRDLTGTGG